MSSQFSSSSVTLVTLLRSAASRTRRRLLRISPKDAEPYATHLPVLMALGQATRVQRVLELGSGPFSTSMFLDRRAFPDLISLTSFEDDAVWEAKIRESTASDPRFDLHMVAEVRHAVPTDLDQYDLIFIDDSRTVAERSVTINAVLSQRPDTIIAIHDFEQRGYRKLIRGAGDNSLRVFRVFTPQVGVVTSSSSASARDIERALHAVESGRNAGLSVTDREGWIGHLATALT